MIRKNLDLRIGKDGIQRERRTYTFPPGEIVELHSGTAYCVDADWEAFKEAFGSRSITYAKYVVKLDKGRAIRSIPKNDVVILGGPEYIVHRSSDGDSGIEFIFYKILFPPTSKVVWVGYRLLSPK